jgi:hypothetical protein
MSPGDQGEAVPADPFQQVDAPQWPAQVERLREYPRRDHLERLDPGSSRGDPPDVMRELEPTVIHPGRPSPNGTNESRCR